MKMKKNVGKVGFDYRLLERMFYSQRLMITMDHVKFRPYRISNFREKVEQTNKHGLLQYR